MAMTQVWFEDYEQRAAAQLARRELLAGDGALAGQLTPEGRRTWRDAVLRVINTFSGGTVGHGVESVAQIRSRKLRERAAEQVD